MKRIGKNLVRRQTIVLIFVFLMFFTYCNVDNSSQTDDSEERSIATLFANSGVPGVSIAVIKDFEIDYLEVHGVKNSATQEPVTERTLFQAASISKSVAAMAAMRLVQDNKIALDDDINLKMNSWEVEENNFTAVEKVTLRRLLSHTAGTTVHGFPGYNINGTFPTLIQVLNGTPPANTDPIFVDTIPGTIFRYSGGGYCIIQQTLMDIELNEFPQIMRETVLEPLAMENSTYRQPLPGNLVNLASAGHNNYGAEILGLYHIYPEMAAAGLWTTPADLALFLIELQLSLREESNRILNSENTELMMVSVSDEDYGLGLMIVRRGNETYFGHGGANEGFRCFMQAHKTSGDGAVVMTNSDNGGQLAQDIIDLIARQENWPGY